MSLGIKKIIITPMQRMVMEIIAADPEPHHYELQLKRTSSGDAITETFTGLLCRSRQLYSPEFYATTLTAAYPDPTDNDSLDSMILINPAESMATLLRQGIWDILFDAEIELDSQPLFLLHDGYFRPQVLRTGEVPDMPLPAAEVGMPMLRTSVMKSNVRKREEWRVPLRLLDDINKDNPDDLGRVWHLAEQVQAAVDLTANLNLGGRGVLDKAWGWRIMEEPDMERDRMSGLRLWITVYVERPIGMVSGGVVETVLDGGELGTAPSLTINGGTLTDDAPSMTFNGGVL